MAIKKQKVQPLDKVLFKGLDKIYKYCTSLPEAPTAVDIEGKFLTLTYSGEKGITKLCIADETVSPESWISAAECFKISMDDLTTIHKAKKCDPESIVVTDDLLSFKTGSNSFKIPIWRCKNTYDPITELSETLLWIPLDVSKLDFKTVDEFARVNLNTGKIYPIGSSPIETKGANVLLVGKKLIPKISKDCEMWVSLQKLDKNFGQPYLLFNSPELAGLLTYPKILIDW